LLAAFQLAMMLSRSFESAAATTSFINITCISRALMLARFSPAAGGEIGCQVQRVHDVNEAVGDEHADDLAVPAQVADPVNAVLTGCRSGRAHSGHGVTGWSSK